MYKFSALKLPTMKYQGQITPNRIPTLSGNVTVTVSMCFEHTEIQENDMKGVSFCL